MYLLTESDQRLDELSRSGEDKVAAELRAEMARRGQDQTAESMMNVIAHGIEDRPDRRAFTRDFSDWTFTNMVMLMARIRQIRRNLGPEVKMQTQHDTNTVTRAMLRTLVTACRSGDMRALDSCGVPGRCRDLKSRAFLRSRSRTWSASARSRSTLIRWLQRVQACRREYMIGQLMAAGCSNRVLRKTFGLLPRDLTRLRSRHGNPQSGRPRRLTETEEACLHDYLQARSAPPDSTPPEKAQWCLETHRELRLPFMAIYSFIGEDK